MSGSLAVEFETQRVGNPFATRHVRPGAIPYLFASPRESAEMLARLEENGWRGEIVGPHGCGKSTLLATLLPFLAAVGRSVVRFDVREGNWRLNVSRNQWQSWTNETLVVVDGYEQLGWWHKLRLNRICRRAEAGLLVTAHTPTGLPRLVEVLPSLQTLQVVVEGLLPSDCPYLSPVDVAREFAENQGNMREALFGLYDLYESRRREVLQVTHCAALSPAP